MGIIVPYLDIPQYGFGLSNAYVSVGYLAQSVVKVDTSYGCSNVSMLGQIGVWHDSNCFLKGANPIITSSLTSNVDVAYVVPYDIMIAAMAQAFPGGTFTDFI